MVDTYKIIRLQKKDTALMKQLLDSAASIHNREKDSIEWLKWKYFNSPFGEAICLLAVKDNVIAGEVTFGRYEYILNNSILKCITSYQTMVHPQHQKKGLFSKLTKEVLAIAKEEDIDLVFNFPNNASKTPFKRLNFTPINHIKNYVHIANILNFISSPTSLKKTFIPKKIKEIDSQNLSLLKEISKTIKPLTTDILTPNRTFNYMKWRYFTQPLFNYKIIIVKMGWVIVRTGKRGKLNEVQIMEIFPESSFNSTFIKQLKKKIKIECNADIILINISKTHPLNLNLIKTGFISLPHNISFFTFAINNNFNNYLNQKNWILTATEFHRY